MKGLLGTMLLVLFLAGAAAAQDVDIQCRVISAAQTVEVTSQTHGTTTRGTYWNCNVPLPFVMPAGQWFCLTEVSARPSAPGVYAAFNHDVPGHDYHGFSFPPNVVLSTPMALPPGDPTILSVVNGTGARVWTKIRVAGFLGQPIGTAREMACR